MVLHPIEAKDEQREKDRYSHKCINDNALLIGKRQAQIDARHHKKEAKDKDKAKPKDPHA